MSANREERAQRFKECSCCGKAWPQRIAFLMDPSVEIVGYQADFFELELGFFLFDHVDCGTSLAVHVDAVSDLFPGPVFADRLSDTDACPHYCQKPEEFRPCPNNCECSYVRNILHRLKMRDLDVAPQSRAVS